MLEFSLWGLRSGTLFGSLVLMHFDHRKFDPTCRFPWSSRDGDVGRFRRDVVRAADGVPVGQRLHRPG